MWQYIISIIFYPMKYLWDNIICRPIYGIPLVSIFAMIAFGMALYRFLVVPYTTGASFHISIKDFTRAHTNQVNAIKNIVGGGESISNKIDLEEYRSRFKNRGY